MTMTDQQPLAEVTNQALRLLLAELGVVNTARFLSQYTVGLGDSVTEKDQLVGTLTVAEIAAAIRQSKQSAAPESAS